MVRPSTATTGTQEPVAEVRPAPAEADPEAATREGDRLPGGPAAGKEITITYGPNQAIPYHKRQERLNHYYFAFEACQLYRIALHVF